MHSTKETITIDQVLSARKTAHKPLGLYDFAPISDGASALILTSDEQLKSYVINQFMF